MKRGVRIVVPIVAAILLVGLFAWLLKGKQIDVLAPAGEIAEQQRQILFFALLLSTLVVVPVFTLLIVFSVKYRAGNKKSKYDPNWGENTFLEGLWWGIPIAIIGVMGVLTYQTTHSLDPYKKLDGGQQVSVQVVGLQWKWLFIYPEHKLATLNYAPMPIDQPVHFTLSTEAPMSAFWIPALGSQIYAMNGMESQLNLKGTKIGSYTGYNTNINGEGYATMKFQAKVMSKSDFTAWVAKAKKSKDVLTMKTYNKLAESEIDTSERTYTLENAELFDAIVQRNMSHGAGDHENSSHAEHEL